MRLGLLKIRTLAMANGSLFVVVGGLYRMFFFACSTCSDPGLSPLEAGLAFLPVTFGIIAGAGLSQQRSAHRA